MSPDGVAETAADQAARRFSDSQQGALQQPRNAACVLLHTQWRDEEGMRRRWREDEFKIKVRDGRGGWWYFGKV